MPSARHTAPGGGGGCRTEGSATGPPAPAFATGARDATTMRAAPRHHHRRSRLVCGFGAIIGSTSVVTTLSHRSSAEEARAASARTPLLRHGRLVAALRRAAERLVVTQRTVEAHVREILVKLGVHESPDDDRRVL